MSKTQSTAISDEIINLIQDEPEGKKDALNLYYRDLSKYPTLSPKEEFLVCQRIQAGRDAALRVPTSGNHDDKRIIEDGKNAEIELINANLRLVIFIANCIIF